MIVPRYVYQTIANLIIGPDMYGVGIVGSMHSYVLSITYCWKGAPVDNIVVNIGNRRVRNPTCQHVISGETKKGKMILLGIGSPGDKYCEFQETWRD